MGFEYKVGVALVAVVLIGCDGGTADGTTSDIDTTNADTPNPDTHDTNDPDTAAPNDTALDTDPPEVADTEDELDASDIGDTPIDTADLVEDVDTTPSAPPTLALTVAQIPASMNGSRPAATPDGPLAYTLRVNRRGFDLDILASDADWDTLDLACLDASNTPVTLGAPEPRSPTWRQLRLGDPALPAGLITCSADIEGPLGTASTSYTFEAADLPAHLDPFPETDLWVVHTERDTFRMTVVELPDGTSDLRSTWTPAGDGVDDFDAPFFELGLMSRASPANARLVRDHLIRKVKSHVQAIYRLTPDGQPGAGPNIAIVFEGDEGAPDPSTFDGTFSRIALTGDGDASDQLAGTFGRALIDWNNQEREDDAVFGLGVWPTALARAILRNSLGVLLLEPYRPAQGGTPFGDDPDDLQFLGRDDVDPGTLTGTAPSRYAIYELVMDLGGMALASILAHEIGHSLGLVPPGAPPVGLFAGMDVDFVVTVTDDAHIDTEGLNVMQTGGNLNLTEAIGGERPAFEPLSWAYLTRQLVVGPPGGQGP